MNEMGAESLTVTCEISKVESHFAAWAATERSSNTPYYEFEKFLLKNNSVSARPSHSSAHLLTHMHAAEVFRFVHSTANKSGQKTAVS